MDDPGEDEGGSGWESVRALASGEGDEERSADIVLFAPKRAARPYRPRHDGFTPAKQKIFFKVLKKTGCIADACRACGISTNTVRRWRDRWPDFDEKVECALAIASVELDMIAYKRATEGAEEKVFRDGKLVSTKIKPSDAMLRLLMQGANPEKYGRTGQMPKAAILRKLKKQAEAEVRAEYRARVRKGMSRKALIASAHEGARQAREARRKGEVRQGLCAGAGGAADPARLADRPRPAGAAAARRSR